MMMIARRSAMMISPFIHPMPTCWEFGSVVLAVGCCPGEEDVPSGLIFNVAVWIDPMAESVFDCDEEEALPAAEVGILTGVMVDGISVTVGAGLCCVGTFAGIGAVSGYLPAGVRGYR